MVLAQCMFRGQWQFDESLAFLGLRTICIELKDRFAMHARLQATYNGSLH
jgi:hypothetical protein